MWARSRTRGWGRNAPSRRARSRASGFTLLEIILTLAIISLLAGVLVIGAVRLTEPRETVPEDIFWKAVGDCRKKALLSGSEVRLRFETKNKTSALIQMTAAGDKRFPFSGIENLSVDFLSTQKAMSAILIGGQLVETQTLPFVTFYGDGTCSPFRVQFRAGGPARTLSIDPWTCALVLNPEEANKHT